MTNTSATTKRTNNKEINQQAIEWDSPIPLTPSVATNITYPLKALPKILQEAVSTYQLYGQQPLSLVACSALANLSLACQSLANVARDRFLHGPISLYFLTAGISGERKSAVDTVFSKVIRTWEQRIKIQREPDIYTAMTLHNAWQAEKETILGQIKRAMFANEQLFYLKEELAELLAHEPKIPLLPNLYFEDATQEALVTDLAAGWPSGSLWSDEAGIILGGHGMQSSQTRFVAMLNRLWDGKPFAVDRKTSRSFTLAHRRLTLNLMMQPMLLQKLANQSLNISRQSGLLARCLLAYPRSSMGERFYKEPPETLDLKNYEERMEACLNYSQDLTISGCNKLPTLCFSEKAKEQWILFFNGVETGLKNQGQWVDVKDFASKAAENAARLAALFHLFEGKDGDISVENTEQAIEIINWHLQEARQLLVPTQSSTAFDDAIKLINWLREKKLQTTTPRTIQQLSPLRRKEQRNNAIAILIEHKFIRMIKQGNQAIMEINPKIHAML